MKTLKFILALFISISFITSCDDDKEKVEKPDTSDNINIKVQLTQNGKILSKGQVIHLSNNYDINISMFKLYLAKMYLVTTDDKSIPLTDIALVDPVDSTFNSFSSYVKPGNYAAIGYGLGVDAEQNNADPTSYSNEHPLSTYQSMIWTMLKYRFAKFEAKVDSTGQLGDANDYSVALHPGTDPLYKEYEKAISIIVSEGKSAHIYINIDIEALLVGDNPFDWETESQTHSEPHDIDIAEKFMANLGKAISVNYSN